MSCLGGGHGKWGRITGGHLAPAIAGFQLTARTPNLRRAQLSFGAEFTSYWIVTVALGVLAFEHGGAAAVGIVGLVRMLPAALLAPPAAVVADRHQRNRVLVAVEIARALTLVGAALVSGLASPVPAYVLATGAMLAHTLYRPTHSALLPSLCTTATGLTAANVVRGLLDSISALVGPLLAGILIDPVGIQGLFVVCAVLALWSAWLVWRVDYEAPPRLVEAAPFRPVHDIMEGLAAIGGERDVRLITVLALLQTFTRGCFTVFSVVVALQLLGLTASGVGILTAAFGAGAVIGSVASSLLVGSANLGRWLAVGVFGWGVPFIALAATSNAVVALVLLGVVGVANAIVDVSGFTLLQWLTPDEVMGRVFTSLESILALGTALGSVAAAGLIAALGLRGALVAAGLVGPVGVLLALSALRRLDADARLAGKEVALLQRVAMLAPLPLATICRLAATASNEVVAPGTTVVQEGSPGADVYVIVDGSAHVSAAGQTAGYLGSAECFGEVSALTGCRRISTVRADTNLQLLRFKGPQFVRVITGYAASYREASALVERRLTRVVASAAVDSAADWPDGPNKTGHANAAHHRMSWHRRGV
jgi:MFS family permease